MVICRIPPLIYYTYFDYWQIGNPLARDETRICHFRACMPCFHRALPQESVLTILTKFGCLVTKVVALVFILLLLGGVYIFVVIVVEFALVSGCLFPIFAAFGGCPAVKELPEG